MFKNRHLLYSILLFISLTTSAQPMTYKSWQAAAKNDKNMQPEYGGAPRTKEEQAADDNYVQAVLKEAKASRHDVSEQLVISGFGLLERGDIKEAMLIFNHAWLMDPKNASVYNGFGAVYFGFKDYKKSTAYYDKGLALDPKNTNLLTYKARNYLSIYETHTDTTAYYKILPLISRSYAIDPKNPYTVYMLSRFYIRSNNCDSALKYFYLCKKLGGQPITKQYEDALKTRCNIKK